MRHELPVDVIGLDAICTGPYCNIANGLEEVVLRAVEISAGFWHYSCSRCSKPTLVATSPAKDAGVVTMDAF